jgi:large subunit ribosomal protein L30
MKKIKITLVKSGIGRPERQKKTLAGLGLTKLNRTVLRDDTPSIRGMVNHVSHLVRVEEI